MTALKSTDKCKQQKLHQDFEVVYEDHGKIPAVALVAIQENTAIMIGNKREEIPKGFMLLMRGDMFHAGAAYDSRNIRLHFNLGLHPNHFSENQVFLKKRRRGKWF